jgi:hypothetical protein
LLNTTVPSELLMKLLLFLLPFLTHPSCKSRNSNTAWEKLKLELSLTLFKEPSSRLWFPLLLNKTSPTKISLEQSLKN